MVMGAMLVVENDPAEGEVDADHTCAVLGGWAFHKDGVEHGVLSPFLHGEEGGRRAG